MRGVRKILVSECLYGGRPVRYDGAELPCADPLLVKWKAEGRLVPVCPEVCGGLAVPRPAAERAGGRVVTEEGADVTAAFERGAEEALRLAGEHDVAFAVLKDGSPSCGVNFVYDGSFSGRRIPGRGVAAELLAASGYRVFPEDEVESAAELILSR
jgi:uncharacterized protein YbbK (DUF523 family)